MKKKKFQYVNVYFQMKCIQKDMIRVVINKEGEILLMLQENNKVVVHMYQKMLN